MKWQHQITFVADPVLIAEYSMDFESTDENYVKWLERKLREACEAKLRLELLCTKHGKIPVR